MKNGRLLMTAQREFYALITIHASLEFQRYLVQVQDRSHRCPCAQEQAVPGLLGSEGLRIDGGNSPRESWIPALPVASQALFSVP
jgi:hypothetical protein